MAFTTLATANSTIGPSQYADMAQALAPRFVVDSPTDLQPSWNSGRLSIQPGAALVSGIRVRATGSNSITLPTASIFQGQVHYVVALRIDWTKGANDAASLVYFEWPAGGAGTLINSSTTPNTAKINRIPGVLYDAVLARVIVGTNVNQQTAMVDFRMWGGDGGPLRVSGAVVGLENEYLRLLDARAGTVISTDRNLYTLRLDDDGVWRAVGTASNPWKIWTPTLRHYGGVPPNGVSGGTAVYLGTNGTYSGRYRVVDGMLDGFVQITTGSGADFGSGSITMDLPLPCANWQADTWSNGHIFTDTTHGGDGNFDWISQALVKAGWTRALLFAPVSGDYGDLKVHRAIAPGGGNGTGYPTILGGKSIGSVYTYNVTYPVD